MWLAARDFRGLRDVRRVADMWSARWELATVHQLANEQRLAAFRVVKYVIFAACMAKFAPKLAPVEYEGIGFDPTDAAE